MKIASYNCRSIKLNTQSVQTLCERYDILCLQETWLPLQEQNYLASINKDFAFYGTSPVDLSKQLLAGRPFGGIA